MISANDKSNVGEVMRVRFRSLTGVLFFSLLTLLHRFPLCCNTEPTSSSQPDGNEAMSERYKRALKTVRVFSATTFGTRTSTTGFWNTPSLGELFSMKSPEMPGG